MCLEANGWDVALAKKNYDELVAMDPVDNILFLHELLTDFYAATDSSRSIY